MDGLISEPPIRGDDQRAQHPGFRTDRLHERLPHRQARQADQEVAQRENGEARHEAAAEAETIDDRPGERRRQIQQRVEDGAGQQRRGLRAQAHLLGDIDRQNRLAAVVARSARTARAYSRPRKSGCSRSNVTWPLL